MHIYIMRHGETQSNKDGLIQGSTDIPLTEYGEELARTTAEGFCEDGISFDRIYTSPLIRAVKTAEITAAVYPEPAPIFIDDRLREMCFGKYEGKNLKDIRDDDENIDNCFKHPSLYVPDETGETYGEVFDRIDNFIDNELLPLESDPELKNVLVICHGTVIRAFLKRFNGVELDDFWKMRQPNCSVNEIELKDGVFTTLNERMLYYEPDERARRGLL